MSIGSPANPSARRLAWTATAAAIALAASLPWWGESSWMREFVEIACYLIFAMMWNLLAGYGGLVSIGQQAYLGVGGYARPMPPSWLVALQVYRIFGSQWLVYWLGGMLPGLWALPAGTGDVLTGLLAVPAALALATGTVEGRKGAMLWNMFGLADLAVAITLGMLMSPGPFQLIIPNGPSMGIDTFPNVLTPAFVVPSSILLHALSLRQLFRHSRVETL